MNKFKTYLVSIILVCSSNMSLATENECNININKNENNEIYKKYRLESNYKEYENAIINHEVAHCILNEMINQKHDFYDDYISEILKSNQLSFANILFQENYADAFTILNYIKEHNNEEDIKRIIDDFKKIRTNADNTFKKFDYLSKQIKLSKDEKTYLFKSLSNHNTYHSIINIENNYKFYKILLNKKSVEEISIIIAKNGFYNAINTLNISIDDFKKYNTDTLNLKNNYKL